MREVKYTIFLFIILTISATLAEEVTVSDGKIKIPEKSSCNITMYNETLYNVERELPGLY